jgi:CheY-like chemotaxis protein
MSREFVDRMWDAFERERTSTVSGIEGTGLGLSITKGIIDLMGGTIEVLTAPGSGTQLVIRLKLKLAEKTDVPEEAQAPREEAAESEVDFSDKRLLLVEDNKVNMRIAQLILTQAGFAVETAENGQIAVDMVSSAQPGHFDAILMDIQMPVMDGYEATRAIRALDDRALAGIPIVALTANAFQEDVDAAKEAGMVAHIAKPVDVQMMLSTLRSVLERR